MAVRYINIRNKDGVETIDEIRREDFTSSKEFRQEVRNVLYNYRASGVDAYASSRCTKEWRES